LTLPQFNPCVRRCWCEQAHIIFVADHSVFLISSLCCNSKVIASQLSFLQWFPGLNISCKTSFFNVPRHPQSYPALSQSEYRSCAPILHTPRVYFIQIRSFAAFVCTVPVVYLHILHTIGKMFYIMYLTSESISQTGNHSIKSTNSMCSGPYVCSYWLFCEATFDYGCRILPFYVIRASWLGATPQTRRGRFWRHKANKMTARPLPSPTVGRSTLRDQPLSTWLDLPCQSKQS
jgi:hypothetical protein